MKKLLFLLFIVLMRSGLPAQQCAFDNYYLFVVHPHYPNNNKKITDLKMYLVDENDQPVRAAVTYKEHKQWKTRSDTLFFWDNEEKVQQFERPLFRRKYYNIGNPYVVAFRLNILTLKDPMKYPVYKLKIEGGHNKKTNKPFPPQIFFLPIQKAVRICNNAVLENYKYDEPVKTLDGKPFEPIDIIVNQNTDNEGKVVDENKGLQYLVRFNYQPTDEPAEGITTYTINAARIYNTWNGKLHQDIYIPGKIRSADKESKNSIEFEDFYNRNITEAKDFSVLTDSWRDLEIKINRNHTNFYIFNTATKKYELDTALSNYNDVFYDKPTKKMRRYDFIATAVSRTSLTYEFNNRQWKLIDKNEELFNPTPPPIKYSPKACILFNEKSHTLPMQAVFGTNASRLITDTFWLYNGCDDTVYISKVQSSTRDFFSINQTLLPKQQTPLLFKGIIQNSSFDFNTNNYWCSLTLADNTLLTFNITVPVVSNKMSVVYNKDSTVNYAIEKNDKKRYTMAVFTYPNGHLKSKGLVLDGDTTLKAGTWRYSKDGTWQVDVEVYSKAIFLSAFEDTYGGQHTNFKISVLENGKWKQPITDIHNNELRFFVTNETDSIIAYTDSASYTFDLSYNKLPEQISKQIYLLKPGQRSLSIGGYTMPFNTIEDSYTLIPNYSILKSRLRTTYQITDSIIAALKQNYPKLMYVYVSRNQRGISLSGLTENEKKQLLLRLDQDSSIGFVCQLFTTTNKQRIGYCNNIVYAYIDVDKPDKFKKTAQELGFTDITEDVGYNRFFLTYKSKMIDEDFFDAFKKLTENKLVERAYFNTYMEAEPDLPKAQ